MGNSLTTLFKNDNIYINLNNSGGENGTTVKIAKSDVIQLVDTSFIYPKEKSVIDKEVKHADVKLSYHCQSNKCDFSDALKSIANGSCAGQLKGLGVKELSELIVETIDQNPQIFPSSGHGFKSYILQAQATGRSFLLLENKSNGKKEETLRYDFIYLTEVRKKLLFQAMTKKENGRNDQTLKDISLGAFAGIAITAVAVLVKKWKQHFINV